MKNRSPRFVLCLFLIAASSTCLGQDLSAYKAVFPSGISIGGSVGSFAIRDDHISDEKYSGAISGFSMWWSRYHETYGYRVGLWYQTASNIKNFNISADVSQGGLTIDNLYPAGTLNLFDRKTYVFLGPSTEILVNYRKQNIAQNPNNGLDIYQSSTWLLSLGMRGEATLVLSSTLQLEGCLQLSLLSVGGGAGNSSNSITGLKLVTLFGGMHGGTELGVRYNLFDSISIKAAYLFDILRINSWNYVLAGSDNAFLSVQYQF
jgi:hypothetical protein